MGNKPMQDNPYESPAASGTARDTKKPCAPSAGKQLMRCGLWSVAISLAVVFVASALGAMHTIKHSMQTIIEAIALAGIGLGVIGAVIGGVWWRLERQR